MKKSRFTLVMFALMAATAAQAQVLNQYGNSFNEGFAGCDVIPAKYSSDSKAYLVTKDQGDKNTQLSVYDDKLNKVKTIDIAEPENARNYTITREREGYTGEWKETKNEDFYSSWYYPEDIHIMNYNESSDYEEGITLTQTLFNNDNAYEYIMPVLTIEAGTPEEWDRDGDGEIDYIRTYYSTRANAFKVVSDNGNTLQTVDMPTGLSFGYLYLLDINDEQYLLCTAYKGDEHYSIFYTIGNNGGNTQIQQVGEPMRTRVYPTVAGRNETITVELDGNGNGEKEIFVSNAAGQTVYKSRVAAGQKQVQINASGLSRGMNIISVKGNNGKANSNKVIVK